MEKENIYLEIPSGRKTMSEIPPFPNSVNAVQQVPKHQIQKIDMERMQGRETNAKQEIDNRKLSFAPRDKRPKKLRRES